MFHFQIIMINKILFISKFKNSKIYLFLSNTKNVCNSFNTGETLRIEVRRKKYLKFKEFYIISKKKVFVALSQFSK